jgi:hypothetical protein
MRYIRDKSGRFAMRPHYELHELDEECEKIISEFSRQIHGELILPIPTDTLTKLVERDTSDLDLFSDLKSEGPDVEGVTDFLANQEPRVRIAAQLSEGHSDHRLRTTLTHEYVHVKFHNFLWQLDAATPVLDEQLARKISPKCKRDRILNAPVVDWMEWQAGYGSGAVLMPVTRVKNLVGAFFDQRKLFGPIMVTSEDAGALLDAMKVAFGVSRDAARVRLLKLGLLTERNLGESLF